MAFPGAIADAKAREVYKGRKASIDPAKVREMAARGLGATVIAKALKIGSASVYRALPGEVDRRQRLKLQTSATPSRLPVGGKKPRTIQDPVRVIT